MVIFIDSQLERCWVEYFWERGILRYLILENQRRDRVGLFMDNRFEQGGRMDEFWNEEKREEMRVSQRVIEVGIYKIYYLFNVKYLEGCKFGFWQS